VETGVARPPPNRLAIALLRRKFEALLVEPEQCLSSASEFLDLVEDQRDCCLLALSSGRDNHPVAATAEMAILIVAVFSSRLSRYTSLLWKR
jgi:hypothetical protein